MFASLLGIHEFDAMPGDNGTYILVSGPLFDDVGVEPFPRVSFCFSGTSMLSPSSALENEAISSTRDPEPSMESLLINVHSSSSSTGSFEVGILQKTRFQRY